MTQVWLTSDLHLKHRRVAELRGFSSTEEHDQTIRERWTSRVRERDTVWVLGDLAINDYDYALDFIASLPGTKHFIDGNHDPSHPMHVDSRRWQKRYLEVFDSVQMAAHQKWMGVHFLMSHFPYSRDRGEARYTQWRLKDEGKWLLHGHTHEPGKIVGREIHVGVDAWDMAPASLNDVLGLYKAAIKECHPTCGEPESTKETK